MDYFTYDEEAVYQEADLLQAQYEAESAEFVRLQRLGYCQHNSWVGLPDDGTIYYDEQIGLVGDQVRCTAGCGQVFENNAACASAKPVLMEE
jgi:hypothetical protein